MKQEAQILANAIQDIAARRIPLQTFLPHQCLMSREELDKEWERYERVRLGLPIFGPKKPCGERDFSYESSSNHSLEPCRDHRPKRRR